MGEQIERAVLEEVVMEIPMEVLAEMEPPTLEEAVGEQVEDLQLEMVAMADREWL